MSIRKLISNSSRENRARNQIYQQKHDAQTQ